MCTVKKIQKRSKQRDEDKWISATDVYTYVSIQIPHYFNCKTDLKQHRVIEKIYDKNYWNNVLGIDGALYYSVVDWSRRS